MYRQWKARMSSAQTSLLKQYQSSNRFQKITKSEWTTDKELMHTSSIMITQQPQIKTYFAPLNTIL